MILPSGHWVPNLSPKQFALYDERRVYTLVSGPVQSGKTVGVLHRIVRHLWETPGAIFAAFARTMKSVLHGGSYDDMTKTVLPEWLDAGLVGASPNIRFDYTVRPKVDGATRTHYFKVRNYFGGESEFFMFSLDHDDEVEEKLKNKRFSGFWFVELSNFNDRKVWSTSSSRMRMMHLKPEQHMWIADTNPAEEGEESWIYRLWYDHAGFDEEKDGWLISQLAVHEIMIEDNPFLDEVTVQKIKAENRHDPDLYSRYVEGMWTAARKGGHFTDVFLPATHVHGSTEAADKDEWQIIVPAKETIELYTGSDLGQTNHSWHCVQKRTDAKNLPIYDVIDELVVLDENVSLREFTDAILQRMEYWETMTSSLHDRTGLLWRHWSDSSSWNFRAAAGEMEERLVFLYSGGRISLTAVQDKTRGSVERRINLLRRLLFENRIFVSAQLKWTIQMLRELRRGSSQMALASPKRMKHIFDSLTYLLIGEEPLEITTRMPGVGPRKASGLVSVPV